MFIHFNDFIELRAKKSISNWISLEQRLTFCRNTRPRDSFCAALLGVIKNSFLKNNPLFLLGY